MNDHLSGDVAAGHRVYTSRFLSVVLIPWTTAMSVICASMLMLLTRPVSGWLAGLGCIAGAVSVLGGTWVFSGDPAGGVASLGLVGGFAVFIWTLVTSVFLIRSAAD